ncbi:MAG TPA: ABC transporter permease [Candidatus Thermoplasmatota archaeon]|nr:ABC transporter permease [Candidatus Thermoplasmatota archaeon]
MNDGNAGHPAGSTTWHATWEVARKEVLQHIRTKRLLIISGLIIVALGMITLVFGPRIARDIGDFGFGDGTALENLLLSVFFQFFGLVFIQLLPIVLTADAVCSEWSSRTIFLLLSKPVSRTAFVLGKYLGSLLTVVVTLVILLGLDYLIMQPLYAGSPSADDVLGFVKFLGFLCVGCAALAALALFFSTVTRSTAIAILITLGVWLVGFSLIGFVGDILNIGRSDPNEDLAMAFHYANPGFDMGLAVGFLVPDSGADGFTGAPAEGGPSPTIALLALLGHVVVWFSGALLIVRKRNFE